MVTATGATRMFCSASSALLCLIDKVRHCHRHIFAWRLEQDETRCWWLQNTPLSWSVRDGVVVGRGAFLSPAFRHKNSLLVVVTVLVVWRVTCDFLLRRQRAVL